MTPASVSPVGDVARKSILINVFIVALKVSRHEVRITVSIDRDCAYQHGLENSLKFFL